MKRNLFGFWIRWAVFAIGLATVAWPAPFGKVVPIGGQASDIALDEARGVLYVANFTASRIEVMSLADLNIRNSINVPPQPGSIALSPDGNYLVVAHFGNWESPNTPSNALTVINLNGNLKQTFGLGFPPLGVAFGADGMALVATTNDFELFDPATGTTQLLDTISGVTAKALPVIKPSPPATIVAASMNTSGNGLWIYGQSDTIQFGYDVQRRRVYAFGYVASPLMAPRVVSVAYDGSYYTAGWGLFSSDGTLIAQFPNPLGKLEIGSHAIDSASNTIYGQIPEGVVQTTSPISAITSGQSGSTTVAASAVPFLMVMDADNLTVREKLLLAENLSGKSLLTSDARVMYSVSDSGVTVLPVGALSQVPRVTATAEDVVFRGNFCNRGILTQDLTIVDPGGGNTPFTLSSATAGISLSPGSGITPATVKVRLDPAYYQNQNGTVTGSIEIKSSNAVNFPSSVRVLINNRNPDQRGSFVGVPGKLVDILPDPVRDRFYILRQDKNLVLVFDGTTYNQIAALRTSNTPTQMAITLDRKLLLVGHDNAHIATVYDLDTLETQRPIVFPGSDYPRSIAVSGNAILAACRVAGPKHTIDRIDLATRTASKLASLGVFQNDVHVDTALVAAPNGSSIMAVMPDGNVMLYNASADTFTVARKDFTALSGTYAASSFDQFMVENNLLNASLVPIRKFETGTGPTSLGFSFVDQLAYRTTAASATAPGVISKLDLTNQSVRPTRIVESPASPQPGWNFIRTLAPLYSRSAMMALTVSGFTVLPWSYDAAVAPPHVDRVVNAADQTQPVAPGGLVTVLGSNMSPVNLATKEVPLPTALGESCLMVNGVPLRMIMVSSSQINAQLPFGVDGNATMVLRTPGGVGDNYLFTILPAAPSIFRSGTAGPQSGLAAVYRIKNNELVTPTNPIRPEDDLVIYATGMGRTSPAVDDGLPGPADPLASVLIPPDVTLGGVSLQVGYAGLVPGQVGVYQINARVPWPVPLGMDIPLTVDQGGMSTTLSVRVVKQ